MQLTEKQRKELVKHNAKISRQIVREAKALVQKAERTNKGMSVHDINANTYKIKEILKTKKTLTFDSEDFRDLCKLNQKVAADLFYLEKGIY